MYVKQSFYQLNYVSKSIELSVRIESSRQRIGETVALESDIWHGRNGKIRFLTTSLLLTLLFITLNPLVLIAVASCYEMVFFFFKRLNLGTWMLVQRVSHFPETEIDNHKEWRAPLAGPGTGAFDLAWGGAVRLTLHLYTFGPTHLNTHHHPQPFSAIPRSLVCFERAWQVLLKCGLWQPLWEWWHIWCCYLTDLPPNVTLPLATLRTASHGARVWCSAQEGFLSTTTSY